MDEWIASLDKLIEKKKLVKQGTMQALLTGKTRLPGFEGKWEERRLGDCGRAIRGVTFASHQISLEPVPAMWPLLRANNIQQNQIVLDDVIYVQEDCIASNQYLKEADVLICAANGSRNLVGKAAVCHGNDKMTFGAFMAVFRVWGQGLALPRGSATAPPTESFTRHQKQA